MIDEKQRYSAMRLFSMIIKARVVVSVSICESGLGTWGTVDCGVMEAEVVPFRQTAYTFEARATLGKL